MQIIKKIDKFINEQMVVYKKQNLSELLITELYLMENYKFMTKLKILIKSILHKFTIKTELKANDIQNIDCLSKKEYVVVQMFKVEDSRHFSILDSLVKELLKHVSNEDILIVTPHKDVANYYKNMSTLIVPFPKIGFKNLNINDNYNLNLSLHHQRLISIGLNIYNIAIEILKITSPKFLLTTQDFHIYDQIFTKAANSMGILTITHQHGMVPYPHPGLFKYIFSDYIMVWGDSTYKTLRKHIPEDKIKIVGTDKFNYLLNEANNIKKEFITIAISPISIEKNIDFLTKALKSIDYNYIELKDQPVIIIKLHPGLSREKKYWERVVTKIIADNKLNIKCITSTEKNYTTLHKTKILIACKSTISLEAMIANCSVIEFTDLNTIKNQNRLFNELLESVVNYDKLGNEIVKRLNNQNYNQKILLKQKDVIKKEIEEFSISKEIKFILKHSF